jgi:hypothetical protein
MSWTDGPDGFNLMFPDVLGPAALERGVLRARELGRPVVGAWLHRDGSIRHRSPLRASSRAGHRGA